MSCEIKPIGNDLVGDYWFENESDEECDAWIHANRTYGMFIKMGHDFGDKYVEGRGIMKQDVTWRVYSTEAYGEWLERSGKARMWHKMYPDTPYPHAIALDLMKMWQMCRNKPVIRHFREVRPDEKGIETLEGYKPCDPKIHYIMRGVEGEEYPITKEIFAKTYDVINFEF